MRNNFSMDVLKVPFEDLDFSTEVTCALEVSLESSAFSLNEKSNSFLIKSFVISVIISGILKSDVFIDFK